MVTFTPRAGKSGIHWSLPVGVLELSTRLSARYRLSTVTWEAVLPFRRWSGRVAARLEGARLRKARRLQLTTPPAARSINVIPHDCYPVTAAVWSVCRDAPLETPRAAARVGTPRTAQKASSPAVTSSMMCTMSS